MPRIVIIRACSWWTAGPPQPTANLVYYVRSTDAAGGAWGTPLGIGSPATVGLSQTALAMIDGRPAVAFQDYSAGAVLLVHALDATGATWSVAQQLFAAPDSG